MKLNELVEKYKKLEGVWNTEGAELARQIFFTRLRTARRTRNRPCRRSTSLCQEHTSSIARIASA